MKTDKRTIDTIKFKDIIDDNAYLFWWVPANKKYSLPLESVVEAVLNYGNSNSIRKLFDLCSIQTVAEIFFDQISKQRNNYLKQTKHYFTLYFKKYAR